jgi:hypothetical protein
MPAYRVGQLDDDDKEHPAKCYNFSSFLIFYIYFHSVSIFPYLISLIHGHESPYVTTSNNVSELSLYSRSVLSKTLLSTVVYLVQTFPKIESSQRFSERPRVPQASGIVLGFENELSR